VFVRIPYFVSDSKQILKSLSAIIKCKFNADTSIIPLYQSFKVSRYFQLKSCIPSFLCAKIVYVRVMRARHIYSICLHIAVGDQMFLEMQDFDFAQI